MLIGNVAGSMVECLELVVLVKIITVYLWRPISLEPGALTKAYNMDTLISSHTHTHYKYMLYRWNKMSEVAALFKIKILKLFTE